MQYFFASSNVFLCGKLLGSYPFGVMGKRWETTDYWKDIIKTHNPRFIRPSGDEILNNCNKVENACFW